MGGDGEEGEETEEEEEEEGEAEPYDAEKTEDEEEDEEYEYEYEYSLMTGVAAEADEYVTEAEAQAQAEAGVKAEVANDASIAPQPQRQPQRQRQRRRLESAAARPTKAAGEKGSQEVQKWRLGNAQTSTAIVKGTLFTYHGDETTAPPHEIAMAYSRRLPYIAGMPGPSYSWSAFAGSAELAIAEMKTDRIMTIVTERLDESLLVASHYLGWSLADVVVTAPRKALSSHPKHADWPAEAVAAMQTFLDRYVAWPWPCPCPCRGRRPGRGR